MKPLHICVTILAFHALFVTVALIHKRHIKPAAGQNQDVPAGRFLKTE